MVEVRLHGALAAKFGRSWRFDISNPAEAVAAIECAKPGFRRAILDLEAKGLQFRVKTRNHEYSNEDLTMGVGAADRVDIIPVVVGANAGTRFVLGAILVAASFFMPASWMLVARSVGISMMIGSVVEWLTPVQKREDYKQAQSWTISGPTNTLDQGAPVPVIYGEVLAGSSPISAGVIASTMSVDQSIDPFVDIGGRFDICQVLNGATGSYSNVFDLYAGPFNLNEPITYSWSKTGFAGATASFDVSNAAGVKLTVTHSSYGTYQEVTGTVTVSVTGKDAQGVTKNVSKTVNIRSAINNLYTGGGW